MPKKKGGGKKAKKNSVKKELTENSPSYTWPIVGGLTAVGLGFYYVNSGDWQVDAIPKEGPREPDFAATGQVPSANDPQSGRVRRAWEWIRKSYPSTSQSKPKVLSPNLPVEKKN